MSRFARVAVTVALVAGLSAFPAFSQDGDTAKRILDQAITSFQNAQYEQALNGFREMLLDPAYAAYQGDAYFWIAKTSMALGRLDETKRNLEHFLQEYPDNPYYAEGNYLKARLLFLEGDYQEAVQAFQRFIDEFPTSPFIANAYYWSAESLFSLGHLDEAYKLFRSVVENYPTSYRVEAARYRISVIELTRREEELMKLLRWSHEEYLSALDHFQKTEQTYNQAIASYQKRLQSLASEDFRAEIDRLSGEVSDLESEIQRKDNRISELQAELDSAGKTGEVAPSAPAPASAQSAAERKLLDLKEKALAVKGEILRRIEADGQGGGQ